MIFLDGSSYCLCPERFAEEEGVAEILDIKGSPKSDTLYQKKGTCRKGTFWYYCKKLKGTMQCKF